MIPRLALALLTTIATSPAALAGVDSCEKIKDADAYNNCLASFGPAAGPHRTILAPEREDVSRARERRAEPAAKSAIAKTPAKPGPQVTRKANGRVRIELMVPSDH